MSKILATDIKEWYDAGGRTVSRQSSNTVTIHVNHPDCPSGTDTKKRLYLTEDLTTGQVLAYCHNCGNSGVWRNHHPLNVHIVDRVVGEVKAPVGASAGFRHFKVAPMATADEAGIFPENFLKEFSTLSIETMHDAGMGYASIEARMYIPFSFSWQDKSESLCRGYQLRKIFSTDKGPKYRTEYEFKSDMPLRSFFGVSKETQLIVIVEDIASEIMVNSTHPWAQGYALMGSHITDGEILKLAQFNLPVLVWLDNDSSTIIKEACRIRDSLQVLGCKSEVEFTTKDPKRFSQEQVASNLEYFMKVKLK